MIKLRSVLLMILACLMVYDILVGDKIDAIVTGIIILMLQLTDLAGIVKK